jgi:hypothetical protein
VKYFALVYSSGNTSRVFAEELEKNRTATEQIGTFEDIEVARTWLLQTK